MRRPRLLAAGVLALAIILAVVLAGCSGADDTDTDASPAPEPAPEVSVPGLSEQRLRGDRLELGAVREVTPGYTSYDVTYRSRSSTRGGPESYLVSGVLNVPKGRGPFPQGALSAAGVDSRLAFYDDGHAFGPAFDAAINRTIDFFQQQGV